MLTIESLELATAFTLSRRQASFRPQLSGFSILAFQLFPLRPVVRGRTSDFSLLTRFHQSQLTQRNFVTRHDVGLSTLSKWLRVESEAVCRP
jgi:hypothetical protein